MPVVCFSSSLVERYHKLGCFLKLKSRTIKNKIKQMLLFEKLLLAIAIPMQICNILVKDRLLVKKEIFPILFETYLNFISTDLAPTKKFRHVRTTRKGIPLNHRSGYRPDAAHPPQMQE